MEKIDGKKIAGEIIEKLKSEPVPKKILAAILVGKDPASISFLKQKEKSAKELEIDFRLYKFSAKLKNDDLRKEVGKIAALKKVGGIIIQLPLPKHINKHYVLNVMPREKDIDVLGERALGAFYTGRNPILPPAAGVVEEILRSRDLNPKPLKIAVVGLGLLIGRPIAIWLTGKTSESYLLSRGSDFSILKNADIVIIGVGKTGLIKSKMLKKDAGIIDFGYGIDENGKISGDFDASLISNLQSLVSFYTPTPGGTGPILVAKLMENFYKLNLIRNSEKI